MFQIFDIPTRVTESTTSLIDLFFVSNLTPVVINGTLPKIADHDGVLCSFRTKSEKPNPKTICVYDYSNVDEKGLILYIKQFNFDNNVFCHPTEYQANHFTEVLKNAFSLYVTSKHVSIGTSDQPWCNSFTRLLLRKKNHSYQFYKKVYSSFLNEENKLIPNPEVLSQLRIKKDKAYQKSREASNQSLAANKRTKNNFFQGINSTMKNNNISAKKIFSILLKLMKTNKHSQTPPLSEGEETINDPQQKSNIYNHYFSSKSKVDNPSKNPPVLDHEESQRERLRGNFEIPSSRQNNLVTPAFLFIVSVLS